MAHPIHKHMGGMKSAERFDAKEAYNKKLSSKARMHYLENDIADKKGSPAHMDAPRKNHKMSNSEYAAHLETPRGKKEHGAGMSRYGSDYGDSAAEFNKGLRDASAAGKLDDNPNFKAKVDASMSRKSSPANNVTYGDISGPTGYMGPSRMGVDPAEAVMAGAKDTREGAGGMSRYKKDHKGMSRYKKDHKGMSRAEYGGNKGDESKSKRDY